MVVAREMPPWGDAIRITVLKMRNDRSAVEAADRHRSSRG
jgi:hypothetical protein